MAAHPIRTGARWLVFAFAAYIVYLVLFQPNRAGTMFLNLLDSTVALVGFLFDQALKFANRVTEGLTRRVNKSG